MITLTISTFLLITYFIPLFGCLYLNARDVIKGQLISTNDRWLPWIPIMNLVFYIYLYEIYKFRNSD